MTIEILALKIVYVPYENVVLKYSNSRSSGGIIIIIIIIIPVVVLVAVV